MKRVDLSVVILNYNTVDLTRTCLQTVFGSKLDRYSMEVIVCDNASTDGSVEMIKQKFRQVMLIENKKNLGFAAGNNPGIKRAKGKYVLLLNTDTEVPNNTLRVMLEFMDAHPEVGASTCKLLLTDGSIDPACHRGFPTPWAAFSYVLKLEQLFPNSKLFSGYHLGYKDFSAVHEVDVISGAFFLVRRKVIDRVGMLDEDYFFYGEDMDWCYRIKEAGWKIVFNPTATILHRKKQSGRAHTDRARRARTELFFYQYNKLFYKKNYEGKIFPPVMWFIYSLFDFRMFFLKQFSL